MSNKGVVPIKIVKFCRGIDTELAAKGQKTFSTICVAAIWWSNVLIGPALRCFLREEVRMGNEMILEPLMVCLKKILSKSLVKGITIAVMLNRILSEEDTRCGCRVFKDFYSISTLLHI